MSVKELHEHNQIILTAARAAQAGQFARVTTELGNDELDRLAADRDHALSACVEFEHELAAADLEVIRLGDLLAAAGEQLTAANGAPGDLRRSLIELGADNAQLAADHDADQGELGRVRDALHAGDEKLASALAELADTRALLREITKERDDLLDRLDGSSVITLNMASQHNDRVSNKTMIARDEPAAECRIVSHGKAIS